MLIPVLQPIVDVQGGLEIGQELLARSYDGKQIRRPCVFDHNDDLKWLTLDLSMLESAHCLPAQRTLFVNISAPTLDHADAFLMWLPSLKSLIHSERHSSIVVEIPEKSVLDQRDMRGRIDLIKNAGAGVALDDYGAWYADEERRLSYPWDWVKVEWNICHNSNMLNSATMDRFLGSCAEQGSKVIMEGIENVAKLGKIHELALRYAQGHFFGLPLPQHNLTEPVCDDNQCGSCFGGKLQLAAC